MTSFVFPPYQPSSVAIKGRTERFPVRRIFCVGRNYEAHAREMGKDPERDPPFFFLKPADTLIDSRSVVAYPPQTSDFQYEIELVVAIGTDGVSVAVEDALKLVWGYAVGIDLTRRDLQMQAREQGRPWDAGKGFDRSAPCAPLHEAAIIGHPQAGRIWLAVNGQTKQDADIADLIWNVAEIISTLSHSMELRRGDIIMTGTPAGVGPVLPGDRITGGIDGLGEIAINVAPSQADWTEAAQ